MSARLLRRVVCSVSVAVLIASLPGVAGADADSVLNQRDLDAKGIAVVKLRRGMTVQTMLEIARRHRGTARLVTAEDLGLPPQQ